MNCNKQPGLLPVCLCGSPRSSPNLPLVENSCLPTVRWGARTREQRDRSASNREEHIMSYVSVGDKNSQTREVYYHGTGNRGVLIPG